VWRKSANHIKDEMLETKTGDLLDSNQEYILHQCNCIAIKPHGLSASISSKFPWADPYSIRKSKIGTKSHDKNLSSRNYAIKEDRSSPASIRVFTDPENKKIKIISLFAQYGMGKPYSYNNPKPGIPDSYELRQDWFYQCLEQVAILEPKSIALPYKIGCGLAGGDWNIYEKIISDFSIKYPNIHVVIVQKSFAFPQSL
jgi:O-acetyl-ADP-ribose deacetylase (regulator of RNase III)